MERLLVLVLRDCSLLNDVEGIENLKNLMVLEISGSPFLEKISDVVFKYMSNLRSLNLSALGIESLPQTVSELTELRRLIIRQCSSLKGLPKLGKLKQLEVIDLSGSSSLIKIQEKSFKSFTKLQVIDLSGTKIEKLPIVQTLSELKLLLVKGCDQLSGLRLMKHLPSLKVLDVSGATRIKEIPFDCFADTDNLRILDLSETEIRFLPDSLGKHLCDLRLKDCPKLERLSNTKDLKDLESLDLSNASSLQKFPDGFLEILNNLQSLNLSNTKVELESLLPLSNLEKLRRLLLKHCLFKSLPNFEKLTSLVELDLSNCENLEALPNLSANILLEIIILSGCNRLSAIDGLSAADGPFDNMSRLQVLDLSETQFKSLPFPCKPGKLRSLILRNCTKLENSPKFENLTQLEQLDLRGTTSLEGISAGSLNHLKQLQTLKLSKSALDQGLQFSQLTGLTALHVLDLSGEAVVDESLSSLGSLSNLRRLLLRDCSSLKELPPLKSLSRLEVLDLSGTKVEKVRDKISELTQLKRLHLPEKSIEEFMQTKPIEEFKEEEKAVEESHRGDVNFPPLELKLDRCCISNSSEIPKGDEKPKVVVLMHGTELFESLKENPQLLESIQQSFWTISSVHSSKIQGRCEDNYGDSRRYIFSNIYSGIRKCHPLATDGQVLEIQGFNVFPDGIEVVLELANYIMLAENQFLNSLSDLKPSILKNIKGCWLERCTKVQSIFTEADLEMGENLEILWLSNLPKLKSLCKTDIQPKSLGFQNLKGLYIDCCPMLEKVFSSAQLPPNLETLQIMFCDELKTVFGAEDSVTSEAQAMSSTGKKVQPTSSANLEGQTRAPAGKEMQETQKKTSADKKVPEDKEVHTPTAADKKASSEDNEVHTPTAADKKASSEDNVHTPTAADKKASSEDDEVHTPTAADKKASSENKEVHTPTPTAADKKASSEVKEAHSPPSASQKVRTLSFEEKEGQTAISEVKGVQTTTKLKCLRISYCPMLETVFSSAQLPKTLEILQIKFCGKLKSLSGQELNWSELPNLQTLHLEELPGWTGPRIGSQYKKKIIKNVKGSDDIIPVEENASKESSRADPN